jgi:HK97 family phage prohead protease
MQHKSFDIVETKADAESGTFEALVAVFGNVDLGGDRIIEGAFTKTLEKWREMGDPIPVILSHKADDPWSHIGYADPHNVTENEKGLHVKGHLDIADNAVAAQVHRLMKARRLKEFSFGYSVPKGGEKRAKDGANELMEIDLFEVGPTLKGMNPSTELHAVKTAIEVEEKKNLPTEEEQRHELATHKSEEETKGLPEVEPAPDPVETLTERVKQLEELLEQKQAAFVKELEEVKASVSEKEPVKPDPIMEESKRTVLDIRTDGVSSRKSPVQVPDPEPVNALPEWQLQAEIRQEMSQILTEL